MPTVKNRPTDKIMPAIEKNAVTEDPLNTEESIGGWWVYMILAEDQSIYTGISTDPERRFQQHLNGKGARFFRGRKPLRFLFMEEGHSRSSASKRETSIKKLTRTQKLALVAAQTR